MNRTLPAISVIIPMYNTEKYIAECLESLIAQTFKNFEVIIVNDCSTDSSPAIVQSYVAKFGGRLKLSHMKKNSGGAPAPRNRGIRISSGEYLYFMDSDDAIISTAFEELYTLAKKFDADVIHCEKYYVAPGETVTTDKNFLTLRARKTDNFTTSPTLETADLGERVKKFTKPEIWWAPWAHLIKREFILDNDIEFPKLSIADDFIFTFCVYCLASKFVIVPNAVYVWRQLLNSNSNYRAKLSPEKLIHRRAGDIFRGIKFLDAFISNSDSFRNYPQCKYNAIDFFIDRQIYPILELYSQIPAASLDDLIRQELDSIGNDTAITAQLFGRMVTTNLNSILASQQQLNQFAAQAQARIAELEKINRENTAYISELENFITTSQKH